MPGRSRRVTARRRLVSDGTDRWRIDPTGAMWVPHPVIIGPISPGTSSEERTMPFIDRIDAGSSSAPNSATCGRSIRTSSVGLPRGGVPVAFEVARALDVPLDVIVVRKLGVPVHPELGMGAVGEDGVRVLTDDVVRQAGVSPSAIAAVEARERLEVERRVAAVPWVGP